MSRLMAPPPAAAVKNTIVSSPHLTVQCATGSPNTSTTTPCVTLTPSSVTTSDTWQASTRNTAAAHRTARVRARLWEGNRSGFSRALRQSQGILHLLSSHLKGKTLQLQRNQRCVLPFLRASPLTSDRRWTALSSARSGPAELRLSHSRRRQARLRSVQLLLPFPLLSAQPGAAKLQVHDEQHPPNAHLYFRKLCCLSTDVYSDYISWVLGVSFYTTHSNYCVLCKMNLALMSIVILFLIIAAVFNINVNL